MDRRFVPYAELENFYKYLYERRKSNELYKSDGDNVSKQLAAVDNESFTRIKNELLRSNRTLYEVVQDLDEMYLKGAANMSIELNKF